MNDLRFQQLIKNLLKEDLTSSEKKELNKHPFVLNELQREWKNTSEKNTDRDAEEIIYASILKEVEAPITLQSKTFRFRWKTVAAIFLFVLGSLSTLLFYNTNRNTKIWYVMHTGHQLIDSVSLADGSKVIVNAGSKLTYPKVFDEKKRIVYLSGQAFFRVKSDKNHPFIVVTNRMEVIALGTSFEVFSSEEKRLEETTLLKGSIRVKNKDKKGVETKSYVLIPNEKLSFSINGNATIEQVDADTYSSWRSGGKLRFRDESLAMILPRLEYWYGINIVCPASIARHYRFTFTLSKESIEEILTHITTASHLEFEKKNNSYIIKKTFN